MKLLLALTLAVFMASPAMAQIWNEVGDAGDLPPTAQIPTGAGPLTAIVGTFGTGDADMYCIGIPNPTAFSATTCGQTTDDTQLWLFDLGGMGITYDDDDPGGCGLQSTITGIACPFPPGDYLIAVSKYNWDPKNPAGLDIWANSPFNVERCPDGPGAPGPVAAWGTTAPSGGTYTIQLAGVVYGCGSTPVEPTTWGNVKSVYK